MRQFKNYPIFVDGSSLEPPATGPEGSWLRMGQEVRRQVTIDNYELPIIKLLDAIDNPASVGQVVLQALPAKFRVLIAPMNPKLRRRMGEGNGLAMAASDRDANSAFFLQDDGNFGRGQGSAAFIFFDTSSANTCSAGGSGGQGCPGGSAEQTLMHELVHALRDMQGRRNPTPVNDPNFHYTDMEELFAILLTNIYMSEKGASSLRKQHSDYTALPSNLATSAGFLSNATNRKYVRTFCFSDSVDMASKIRGLAAPFNPIREMLANPAQYP